MSDALKATAAGAAAGLTIGGAPAPAEEPVAEEQQTTRSFLDFAALFGDVKDHPSVHLSDVDVSMVSSFGAIAATFTLAGEGRPMFTEGTRKYVPQKPGYTGPQVLDPNLHPLNFAYDVRAKHIPEPKRQRMLKRLKKKLPKGFRVKLHGTGASRHFHIERYDEHTKKLLAAHRKKIGWKAPKKVESK